MKRPKVRQRDTKADVLEKNRGIFSSRLQILSLLLLWVATFYPVYPELIHQWLNDSNNSHGLLVPFISLFILYQKRDKLFRITPESSYWGLVILAASLIIYLIGHAGHIAFITRVMIVCSLAGLVLYNFGWTALRTVGFPLLFLFFMVPVPDSVYAYFAFPLQLLVSKMSAALIQFISIPIYREGNMLYFAQAQLEVAEACSGLRSITSFLMLSVLFAYMLRGNWLKRTALVLLAVPLAMLVNIIRVTGTGILAHFRGGEVARGFMHEFSGMVVFTFGIVLLACFYAFLNRSHRKTDVTS
jgi:exosortase